MALTRLDWLYLCGAAVAAAGAIFCLVRFGKRDPEQAERRRRERIQRIGRLAQCEILDILEGDAVAPGTAARKRLSRLMPPQGKLVVYRYTVSGVTYETSQDFIAPSPGARPPLPGRIANVKYDPANPSNSILLSERLPASRTGAPRAVAPGRGK